MNNLKILDEIQNLIYISDIETYDLIFLNKHALQRLKIKEKKSCYGKCYKILYGKNEPCEFCNNDKLIKSKKILWEKKYKDGTYYLSYDHMILINNKWMRMKSAIDISPLHDDIQKTRGYLEIEKILNNCIHRLISSQNFEESVSHVLKSIVDFYKGSRGYIFDIDWSQNIVKNTYEQCAPNVTQEINNLQDVPLSYIAVWLKKFEEQGYVHIKNIDDLKNNPSRNDEYEMLQKQGIQRLLAVPFSINGKIKGFLGVDDPKQNIEEISLLLNLTYFIAIESEKRQMQKKLEELSYEDGLTGLYNRNRFTVYEADYAKREPSQVGVAFFDLNSLKSINDNYGHDYGDIVLKHVGEVLRNCLPQAMIFRMSGDEFLIIYEEINYTEFYKLIQFTKEQFIENGKEIVSCGFTWSKLYCDLSKLITKADKLMYSEKQRFYLNNEDIYIKQPTLLKNLLKSLAQKDKYKTYIQPKQRLSDDGLIGGEMLIRYFDSIHGLVMPNKFIPLLEKENLISHIDFFMLEETCKMVNRLRKKGYPNLIISMNFSRITLLESNFFTRLKEIIYKYNTPTNCIEIEVTESGEILSRNQMMDVLIELKKLGFRIAIDDFGVEYACMEILTIVQFDVLKIDRQLTQYVLTNRGQKVLRGIIDLSHNMGIECLAEGVETEEMKQCLKRQGCDYIQGYLYGRSMPLEEFENKFL